MNGINAINSADYIKGISLDQRLDQRVDKKDELKEEQKIRTAEEEAREKRVYEDTAHPDEDSVVLGRNMDGDTSRASRTGLENLKEGIVIKKDPAQEAAAQKEAKDEEEKSSEKVSSMLGFTDTQVEELYYQGKISKNDYQTEIDRRDRIDKEAGLKEEEKEDDEKNPVIEASKEEEKKVSEEKAAKAKDESTAPADSMGNKDDKDKKVSGEDDDRKKLISDEMERDNAFAKEMGQINQRQQDFSLRADAITEGIANDRAEKVIDILDAAEKIANGEDVRQN